MPGATPIYGIPYPLETDPYGPTDFSAFAVAIEGVVAETQRQIELRTRLPSCQATASQTGLAAGSGVLTTIQFSTEVWDTANIFTPTSGNFTVPLDGVYMIQANTCRLTGMATVTLWDWVILVNGVFVYQVTQRPTSSGSIDELNFGGLWRCHAGDVVTLQGSFYGTGAATDASARFTLTLTCPLV